MSGTATKPTSKVANKTVTPATTAGGSRKLPPPPTTKQDESDDDEEDGDEGEEKPFEELCPEERDKLDQGRVEKLLTNPIFRVRYQPYRELVMKEGATKISEAPDGHYYQFKGKMDQSSFLLALVRFGHPVTQHQVDKFDQKAKDREVRETARKAGLIEEIKAELLNELKQKEKDKAQNKGANKLQRSHWRGTRNRGREAAAFGNATNRGRQARRPGGKG